MFDLNLLSEPGIQSTKMVDSSISFFKEKRVDLLKATAITKNKRAIKKPIALPSVSLYAIIFIAIVGVIFYPMVSDLNFKISIQSEKVSQEVVIDKVLKVILQGKDDYIIDLLQFSDEIVLIRLSSFDMSLMKFFQEEIGVLNRDAVRVFGDNNNYSMIAKFPWEIMSNDDSIDSPESFFKFVKTGKHVKTLISEDEIVMQGSTSDIISIFLQLTNADRLQTNEMVIHSTDNKGSLIFAVKFPN